MDDETDASQADADPECDCSALRKRAAIRATETGTVLHALYDCVDCGREHLK